ncbi:hypothetical protein [Nocardia iowensis]|uniref:Uncharacterized protein n=1 Tax=Nocardia iowensis TaxID=204891 RepID=A0ABX8RV29_NOCIO|nr:hypothetical protein [Nocardia iowensis]QXN93096.1 hypothetical protein KV110_08320 [Nocardia iowensis]
MLTLVRPIQPAGELGVEIIPVKGPVGQERFAARGAACMAKSRPATIAIVAAGCTHDSRESDRSNEIARNVAAPQANRKVSTLAGRCDFGFEHRPVIVRQQIRDRRVIEGERALRCRTYGW